jgi:membrane protein YdbS with pleckstrin-like domain
MTEKDFPVSTWWILIAPVGAGKSRHTPLFFMLLFILAIIFVFFIIFSSAQNINFSGESLIFYIGIPLLFFVLALPAMITNLLRRNNFHFSLDDTAIDAQNGIVNKQQLQLPYAAIQDVQISRKISERLFGLATVMAKNTVASTTGQRVMSDLTEGFGSKPSIGISDGQIIFPGLKKTDAENLKAAILAKMGKGASMGNGTMLQ